MGVVYHVHEAFPQKPDLKHLIPAQTASAVPAVLFLPSVHFLPAPSGHPYLAQVPLSLILQFLLQSFSLSPTDLAEQERFMANMFGFPYFKESRHIQIPGGTGGYWYRLIDTPDFNKRDGRQ